jgi:hypothetical protein
MSPFQKCTKDLYTNLPNILFTHAKRISKAAWKQTYAKYNKRTEWKGCMKAAGGHSTAGWNVPITNVKH